MKYVVTTDLRENSMGTSKLYHCDEPEKAGKNETYGGFDYTLATAIQHNDLAAAKTTRNRMQKYYPDFPMYISTFEDKEIFIGILKGTVR